MQHLQNNVTVCTITGTMWVDAGNFFYFTVYHLYTSSTLLVYVKSNLVSYNVLTCIRQMKCNFDKIFYIKNSACIDEMKNTMCIKYRKITLMKDICVLYIYVHVRWRYTYVLYCVTRKRTVFEFFMKEFFKQKIHQKHF